MKTALIIIPSTGDSVNRHAYISACIDFVEQEGYTVDCPALLEGYTSFSTKENIDKRIAWADSIFLFTDFGIDGDMLDVAERLVKAGRESAIIYKKLQNSTKDKIFSEPVQILRDVARRTGVPVEMLISKTRIRAVTDARFVYFRRCREVSKASLSQIGLPVGKDHASVMHGLKEARKTQQVINLYNKCYGEAESQKKTVEQLTSECSSIRQPEERSVLPLSEVEEGEQSVPGRTSPVRAVPERGFYGAFAGYRPHNT